MSNGESKLYVGYLPLPKGLKLSTMMMGMAWVIGMVLLAFLLASNQQDPGPAKWDTTKLVAIEGHLTVEPYPMVFVHDPNSPDKERAVLLVSAFKFGALTRATPHHGKRVRATGHFITRQGRGVLELVKDEDAIIVLEDKSSAPKTEILGEFKLAGEITDSKCFLGVMKPGFGKTHRACAVRCISGGIPPILVTRDTENKPTVFVLTNSEHKPINEEILPFVSEPVELTGQLQKVGDLLIYAIDPSQIVRK